MFSGDSPKFVEASGVQLLCPYCHHKFRAPQGLIAHKHMHEQAGDTIYPMEKFKFVHHFRKSPIVARSFAVSIF